MALKKLEELGYKPKKRVEKKDSEKEIAELLKNIENNEARKQILDLLVGKEMLQCILKVRLLEKWMRKRLWLWS